MATEKDTAQDDTAEGILSFTPPWTVGSYGLDLTVYEDNDPAALEHARWHFTVEVEEGK